MTGDERRGVLLVGGPAAQGFVLRRVLVNLSAVRPAYERAGVRFYVLARAVETRRQVEAVRAASGLPLRVVRVTADPAVAEARMRARDAGAELENLGELGRVGEPVGGEFALANDGRPIRDVARGLLDRLGWARIAA